MAIELSLFPPTVLCSLTLSDYTLLFWGISFKGKLFCSAMTWCKLLTRHLMAPRPKYTLPGGPDHPTTQHPILRKDFGLITKDKDKGSAS